MKTFATLSDPTAPVRIILVGAGQMGQHWLEVLEASDEVTVVGVVDIDLALAQRVIAERHLVGVTAGVSVRALAAATNAQAVVNVTIPAAHHSITTESLFAGLPVLSEKPIAPTAAEALSLAAAADAAGQLLMTSQSRRYFRVLAALRDAVRSLGEIDVVSTEFFRGPRFGGFRDEMAQPLLIDMAIHAFDVSRYLLGTNPRTVYCETFNPQWSWYRGDASASAIFEFDGGTRYVFTGSWCSQGEDTSWNGNWRVSGAEGTALWDGEAMPTVARVDGASLSLVSAAHEPASEPSGEEIGGALTEFVGALRTGDTPSGDVHSNIYSLAMVEAAALSADSGRRVVIAEMLERAWADAVERESRPEVRDVLLGWGSAAAGLTNVEPDPYKGS